MPVTRLPWDRLVQLKSAVLLRLVADQLVIQLISERLFAIVFQRSSPHFTLSRCLEQLQYKVDLGSICTIAEILKLTNVWLYCLRTPSGYLYSIDTSKSCAY